MTGSPAAPPGAAGAPGFEPAYYGELARAEGRHFWFRARNRILRAALGALRKDLGERPRILEVGCGSGNVLRMLAESLPGGLAVGADAYREGLAYAGERSPARLVQCRSDALPFREAFGLAGLFDVIEHVDDDAGALREVRKTLVPGGFLLVTVPARMSLWSYHDELSHHRRRYARKDLRRLLAGSGFEVLYLTEFFALLYPLVWVRRRLKGRTMARLRDDHARRAELHSRDARPVPVLNGILLALLALEVPWIRLRLPIPLGTSLLAVARKKT